MRPFDSQW
ncbi:duf567 domain protein, partial [Moniliophthora roreri]